VKIGVPREIKPGETRVAIVPAVVGDLTKMGAEVLVEAGAGRQAHFGDEEYEKAGAVILPNAESVYRESDLVTKVHPPMSEGEGGSDELKLLREGSALLGFLSPLTNRHLVDQLVEKRLTAFSMELVPRITRAQSMDALSSMSTVAGYKAVLIAASHFGKFFPLLMTAAGTIPPATVLILGAGVAGLQAIATAKRLGAKVEAFDTRIAVKEQVESLGAYFVEMEMPEDAETEGGYAKEVSEEFIKKELEAISSRLPKTDIVIPTAQVFGKKAPILITEEMVKLLREGSVIVDLAAEQGGNCELTEPGKVVRKHGVTIDGSLNIPALLPVHASQMYARNVTNLVKHLYGAEDHKLDFDDEITRSSCVCSGGELVSELVKNAFSQRG